MSPQWRRRSWGEAVLGRGRGIVRGDLCRRHRGPSSILPKDPPKLEVYAARRYARSASAKTAPAAPAAATRGVTNVHRGLGFSLDCPLRCPINGEPLHRGQAACQGPPAPKVTLSVGDPPVQVGEPRLGLGEAALLVDELLLHRLGPPLHFGKSVLSERKLPLQEMKPRLVRGAPGGAISASHVGALLGRGEALLHLRAAWRRPRLLLCAATAALDPGQLLPEVLGKVHEAPVQHLPHLRESGLARSPLIPHKCPEPLPVPRELLREVLRGRPGPVLVTGLLRRVLPEHRGDRAGDVHGEQGGG
eukprot:CAMPEP_0175226490 /NCGR_PEP_ID=MMETSP0093-20121207/22922_1 /TAXON_ID=311494 /ORGANISM="Alexandrium monilatum, Strain CCMP3105" /LENGTH=303 /DNA_ID=CAMNT_0016520221 /DNA_START=69 /DNA_END=976 /DNA_ORIENTATION=-